MKIKHDVIKTDAGCSFSQTQWKGLSEEVLSTNKNEVNDEYIDSWEKSIPGRKKQQEQKPWGSSLCMFQGEEEEQWAKGKLVGNEVVDRTREGYIMKALIGTVRFLGFSLSLMKSLGVVGSGVEEYHS